MLSFNEQEKEAAVRFCVTALFVTIQFLETKKIQDFHFFQFPEAQMGRGFVKGSRNKDTGSFSFRKLYELSNGILYRMSSIKKVNFSIRLRGKFFPHRFFRFNWNGFLQRLDSIEILFYFKNIKFTLELKYKQMI